jgi:CheY-like chemotaxis protein
MKDTKSAEAPKNLQGITQDVHRLGPMIEDLLDVAKIDSKQIVTRPKGLNINSVATRLIESFHSTAPQAQISLVCPTPVLVWADSDRVQQILGNLISNAIKYGTAGTPIRVFIIDHGGQVQVSVENSGRGLKPNQLTRIFERYVRTQEAMQGQVGGLGLGLFITKGLVEAQGGRIWAESVPGEKTTFHFTLPKFEGEMIEKAMEVAPDVKPYDCTRLGKLKILLVDDSADNLLLMRKLLEKVGAQVETADSVDSAVRRLKFQLPDMVLSDIEMPGGGGYELLQQVREISKRADRHIPTVAITAHSHPNELKKISAAGFDMQISKPISFQGLISSLEKVRALEV